MKFALKWGLLASAALASASDAAYGQTVFQDFNPSGWTQNYSNDGIWRINGNWPGTYDNTIDIALAKLVSKFKGDPGSGYLELTTQATGSCPTLLPNCLASEVQSLPGFTYGYYETRMRPSCTAGAVQSFFLTGVPYVNPEFDIEFLTEYDDRVFLGNHPTDNGGSFLYPLGFNPCAGFHRYGILWVNNGDGTATVSNAVDGKIVHSETSADMIATSTGSYIMMNSWNGNPNWGGAPPKTASTAVYDWVKFYAGATSVVPCTSGTC